MPEPDPSRPASTRTTIPAAFEANAADTRERPDDLTVLVQDAGFRQDDWTAGYVHWNGVQTLDDLPDGAAINVANSAQADELLPALSRIALIRVAFPTHMDGRGFSLARHLRLLGYRGRLRASGHIVADQYAMARRSGFDEVEIAASLAERQPEEQWLFRANWRENDYQNRLRRKPKRKR